MDYLYCDASGNVKTYNKDENHDNTVMNIDEASFWE
jgi:hypothetical protein